MPAVRTLNCTELEQYESKLSSLESDIYDEDGNEKINEIVKLNLSIESVSVLEGWVS